MQAIGGLLVFLGAGSFILNMLGREFALTSWIDTWGQTPGIGIRVAMIVVGAALWFMGRNKGDADAGEAE